MIAGSGGVDSATVLGLIDSAHVQLRQDYSYASLTGTPNVLDSADVSLIAGSGGVDSATVLSLIDSAHVQLRQDYAYASLTGVPNVLDSADVSLIAGGSGGGLDSSLSISLINTTVDSAYVQSKITSSTIYTRTITTATASQTVFAATYTPNYVDVYVNGIKILNTTDFTATNGTSVTLLSSSDAGDIVEITAWAPTAIVDVVRDIIQEGNTSVEAVDTGTGGYVAVTVDGTETARFDSAGDFQFNSGYGSVATAYGCRAWVNFNGTGTVAIRASGNVSSITDNGTGHYIINFTTAMPDANYSVAGSALLQTNAYKRNLTLRDNGGTNLTTSSVTVHTGGSMGNLETEDCLVVTAQIIR